MTDETKESKPANRGQRVSYWFNMHLTWISAVQKIFFLDHLRTMTHASISIVEALDILHKEVSGVKFKTIVSAIKAEVEKGRTFSEVLLEYPKLFPHIYVKMVEAGEISGKLDESMEQIIIQMKKSQALTSTIRGAMIYPIVIVSAMGGVAVLMVTVVLPKLTRVLKEFGGELPLPTRILIRTTDIFGNPVYLGIITLLSAISIFSWIVLLKKSPRFKHAVHRLNLSLPIVGGVIKQINLARFSLTLSSLLKSTIPIIDAVDVTADTCTNVLYSNALHETAKKIRTGASISDLLREYPKLFPPTVTEMIMVGERSGQVDHLLNELSEFFSAEVDKTMKNFATIIEPVIIVALGLAVAGLAVSVIMPIYSISQNI